MRKIGGSLVAAAHRIFEQRMHYPDDMEAIAKVPTPVTLIPINT